MLPDWMSDDALGLLAPLTPRQRNAIVRIVEAELDGRDLRSLLRGPDKICNETTYYRQADGKAPAGWYHQEAFRRALDAARAAAWGFGMEHAVREAVQIITITAPAAARELQRQVRAGEKDTDRRAAAKSVLDRADRATATKAETFDVGEWARTRADRLAEIAEMEE